MRLNELHEALDIIRGSPCTSFEGVQRPGPSRICPHTTAQELKNSFKSQVILVLISIAGSSRFFGIIVTEALDGSVSFRPAPQAPPIRRVGGSIELRVPVLLDVNRYAFGRSLVV